jgi:phenylacetate-coenzyme A ligase PaaK-like adenylate-forming protein
MLTQDLVNGAIEQALKSERLSADERADLQRRKLRELVRHAAGHSAFYRDLYRSIDPDEADLTDLPTVNKATIQAEFDRVVTDPRLRLADAVEFCRRGPGSPWHLGAFAVLLSSGTSGQRGYYVYDGPALADALAQGARQSNRGADAGEAPGPQRIAAVMLIEPFDAAGLLMRLIPESLGPKRFLDIRQDFERICDQLNEFQPTFLSSFPYVLRMLSAAALAGRLRIRPARITSSGDVLTDSDRGQVRQAFGIDPFDYYCSTEVPYIAWECDAHDGLHVNADYVIVESVDARNRPVPPGRLGSKLLVTNLSNRVMPLVRYELADQVEFLPGDCPCGCPLPRFRKVLGRVEHILSLPGVQGGRVALIPEHLDHFVGGLDGLANYQIIQEAADRLKVNFIVRGGADPGQVRAALQEGLGACFRRYGVAPDLPVGYHRAEQLEPVRPGATKVCHFWNRSGTGREEEGQA